MEQRPTTGSVYFVLFGWFVTRGLPPEHKHKLGRSGVDQAGGRCIPDLAAMGIRKCHMYSTYRLSLNNPEDTEADFRCVTSLTEYSKSTVDDSG